MGSRLRDNAQLIASIGDSRQENTIVKSASVPHFGPGRTQELDIRENELKLPKLSLHNNTSAACLPTAQEL